MPSESFSFPDNFRAAIRRRPLSEQIPTHPQVTVEIKRPAPVPAPPDGPKISPASAPLEPRKISVVPRAKVRSLCKPKPGENSNEVDHGHSAEAEPADDHERENVRLPMAKPIESVRYGLNPRAKAQAQRTWAKAAVYPRPTQPLPGKRGPNKLLRFLVCEALAISVLIPSAILGISRRFTDQNVLLLINILIIAAAATIAILPMIFYGRGETLPQREESGGSPQQRGA